MLLIHLEQESLLLKVIHLIGRNNLGTTIGLWNLMNFRISTNASLSDSLGKKLRMNQNASLALLIGGSSTDLNTLVMLEGLSLHSSLIDAILP